MTIRILLAEDEEDLMVSAEFRLKASGFEVLLAKDGREALDLVRAERPNLALLDIRMPHLTGIEICRIMKADEELKKIPVILMTASTEYLQEKVAEARAEGVVTKPFNAHELMSLINKLTQKPKTTA